MEDVAKHQGVNPCCAVLKEKCSKLEASRKALRHAVKIQNEMIDKLQNENLGLKKVYEEERVRVDAERQEKANESAIRVSLENEIHVLKSEMLTLQQRAVSAAQDVNGEVLPLQMRISELETEINDLNELVEKERMKADSESRKAQAEKKKASEALKVVKAEKSRADEERRLADIERKKVEENQIQLEKLKSAADEARSKLVSEAFKSEEANKNLEAERQKVMKEKKRADSEKAKAEEKRKLAEINQKKAMDEKCRADHTSQQVEEHRKRIEILQKELEELVHLRKLVEAPASDKHMDAGTAKVTGGLQADILGSEADDSKLVSEYLKSEQANKRLKEEKKKVTREKKRADLEMRKAEEQRKVAETHKKKSMEEKHRADQLAQQLEDNKRRIEELQKETLELVSSRTLVEAPVVLPDTNVKSETTEMKMLRKQLRFKKKQEKHAKEVAKLEIGRNNILQQELRLLRQEFIQFLHRLDVLNNSFSCCGEGRDDMEKNGNIFNTPSLNLRRELSSVKPHVVHLHCNNELGKTRHTTMDGSDYIRQTVECNAPLLPITGGNYTHCTSGIDSKLEPLLRGSNRKMLQSSAINSSTESFSDRPLMGSQERGAFSVTTSAKLAEEKSYSQPNISCLSGEVTKTRYKENLAVVAENSVRSPTASIDADGRRAGHSKKRKRNLDVVKSIEHLYAEGKKWHLLIEEKLSMLHGMLNSQMDKSFQEERSIVPSLECDPCAEQVRAHKKRKASPEKKVALQHLCDSNEREKRVGTGAIEKPRFCDQTFLLAGDQRGTARACKDGIDDSSHDNQDKLGSFEELLEGNYMRLLDLDNSVDEECYCRAIEMPLSPTLPMIEFQRGEIFEIDKTKHLVDASSYEGFSIGKDNLMSSSSFDVVNVEIESNKLKLSASEAFHDQSTCKNVGVLYPLQDVAHNENGESCIVFEDNACAQQMRGSNTDLGMSDLYSFGHKGTEISCQNTLGLVHDELPRYCVVFSDTEDSSSISRIFRATGNCIAQCSMISWTDHLMQKVMHAHLKMEDLLPKEKACVFFSVLLHNFSGMALENFGNFLSTDSVLLLDSFAGCLRTVTSGVETRSIFAELCLFGGLLSLIEDFLLERRVLVYGDVSSESLPISGSRVNILLNEAELILSRRMATTCQLVAGGIILASICAAVDHIGFLCEASYNILKMQNSEISLMMTFLHVFACVGGTKYFNLKDYSLTMTVVKSLVTFLERANLSSDYTYCLPSAGEVCLEIPSCTKCPFSEGALSMDIIVSMLFERLQNYTLSGAVHQDPMETLNSSTSEALSGNKEIEKTSGHEGPFGVLSMSCSASCCLNKFGTTTTQSNFISEKNLCHFTDVLSLVELVACKMSWDWTCKNIVSQMLKLLESCVLDNFSTVTVILLGKLGRLGVDASGYEDNGVENLKSSLSAFLCQKALRKSGLPIQIATANALLGLLSLDFEELIKSSMELPAVISQSDPAVCIRKWYSMLSSEQQSLSFSILQSDGLHGCRTG